MSREKVSEGFSIPASGKWQPLAAGARFMKTLGGFTPACKLSFSTGGLNECIEELKRLAVEQDVPVFFVMNRRGLGRAILRKVPVSVVGVMNFAGTDVSNLRLLCGFSGSALHST